jgi:hypothetical protein
MARALGIQILENPSASPVATGGAWGTTNIGTSSFAGTSPFYPLPPYGTGTFINDCYIDYPNVQTVTTATPYVIPPGWGACLATTGTSGSVSYQVQQGTVGTWVTLFTFATSASNTYFFYMSDGVNFRISAGTASATITLFQFV